MECRSEFSSLATPTVTSRGVDDNISDVSWSRLEAISGAAAVDVDPESAAPETWWAEDRCSVLPGAGAAETRARPKSGSRVGLEEQNQSYLIMLDGLMKIQVHVVKKALVSIESVKV